MVCLTVCSGADQRKYQSSVSPAFVSGIHWWPVNSPHKGPVTWKMLSFDDVIMHCHLLKKILTMYGRNTWKCLNYNFVFVFFFPLLQSIQTVYLELLYHICHTDLRENLTSLRYHVGPDSIEGSGGTVSKWRLCGHWLKGMRTQHQFDKIWPRIAWDICSVRTNHSSGRPRRVKTAQGRVKLTHQSSDRTSANFVLKKT